MPILNSAKAEYEKSINQAQSKLGNDEIKKDVLMDEQRRLGMLAETPQQAADKWLNERLAVVGAKAKTGMLENGLIVENPLYTEAKSKFQAAQSALLDAELDPLSTLAERQALEKQAAAREAEFKKLYDKQFIPKQVNDMLTNESQWIKESQEFRSQSQIDNLTRTLTGRTMTPEEAAKFKTDSLRANAVDMLVKTGAFNVTEDGKLEQIKEAIDPRHQALYDLLNNKAEWQNLEDRERQILQSQQDLRIANSASNLYAAQMTPLQIPAINRIIGMTNFGRALMSREQRTSQFIRSYGAATSQVEKYQNDYNAAIAKGDMPAIAEARNNLEAAMANRASVR